MPQVTPKDRNYRLASLPGPCRVKGCISGRYAVSGYCRHHRSRVGYAGHPTITPPRAPFRRRLIKHIRTALDRLDMPEAFPIFNQQMQVAIHRQATRNWPEHSHGYFVAMAEADPLDLFAAFVAFEVHELTYRDLADYKTVPSEWLTGKKLRVYKARQLRAWINCVITSGPLSTSNGARHQHAKAIEFLLVPGSVRPQRWAAPLAAKLADILRKKISDERATEDARKAARAVAKHKKNAPYGINPDGTIDMFRSEDN